MVGLLLGPELALNSSLRHKAFYVTQDSTPRVRRPARGAWEHGFVSTSLVLIGTPIGNLGDLSPRAAQALAEADVIYCEDTRRTRILLSALEIPSKARLVSLHEHNEHAKASQVIEKLKLGEMVVVVSDAGMPGISDPGADLVAQAVEQGCGVTVIPGPSAVLGALVISGLATDRFVMEGFLPRKGRERRSRLEVLAREERTSIVFESPHRLVDTLQDVADLGDDQRRVCVVRELTKIHEEVIRGTVRSVAEHFGEVEVRGEIVIVLEGAKPVAPREVTDAEIQSHLETCLASGMSKRDAASAAASELKVPRSRAYELASSLAR